MAKGALIERLGCSAAEAADQLTALASEAGTPVAEIAAAIIGHAPATPPTPTGDGTLRSQLTGAAMDLAADGGEMAAAILDHALVPLGASAVAMWLIRADGGLDLLGEAGLGPAEASRWRRIPSPMDCPAQRVAHGGPDLWWPAGPPGPVPAQRAERSPGAAVPPPIGRWPDGARAVAALHDRGRGPAGVMEVCWPQPRAGFPDTLRQQLGDLAQACADLLSTRAANGDFAMVRSRPALRGLLDSLLESMIIASAVRDGEGQISDFRIDYAGGYVRHTAGRNASELTGRTLLEVYPTAAAVGGVLERAVRTLTTGQAQHVPGPVMTAPAGEVTGAIADIRIARFFDGVVLTLAAGRSGRPVRRGCSRSSGSAGSAPGRRTWSPGRRTGPSPRSRSSACPSAAGPPYPSPTCTATSSPRTSRR